VDDGVEMGRNLDGIDQGIAVPNVYSAIVRWRTD